nr:MAG TPA: hypothetical protein [Caudoviricetes sp.]
MSSSPPPCSPNSRSPAFPKKIRSNQPLMSNLKHSTPL